MDSFLQLTGSRTKNYEETNLHHLLIATSRVLQCRHDLTNSEVKRAALIIQEQLKIREWRKGPFNGIEYNDKAKRCGYLERYASCHAALVANVTSWIFQQMPLASSLLLCNRECLNVVCAGGGPGNDMLGFCSAIKDILKNLKSLNLTVVDLKAGWRETFETMMLIASSFSFGNMSQLFKTVSTKYRFVHGDLTHQCISELKQADIILMVKVLSNVSTSQKQEILQNMFSSMKDGAMFFYIDIDESEVEKWAAYFPKIKILIRNGRQVFHHSISSPLTKLIPYSSYEICVLQKVINNYDYKDNGCKNDYVYKEEDDYDSEEEEEDGYDSEEEEEDDYDEEEDDDEEEEEEEVDDYDEEEEEEDYDEEEEEEVDDYDEEEEEEVDDYDEEEEEDYDDEEKEEEEDEDYDEEEEEEEENNYDEKKEENGYYDSEGDYFIDSLNYEDIIDECDSDNDEVDYRKEEGDCDDLLSHEENEAGGKTYYTIDYLCDYYDSSDYNTYEEESTNDNAYD